MYTKEEMELAYEDVVKVRVKTLVQILDTINRASDRGAYKASEMSSVGLLYDTILDAVEKCIQKVRDPNTRKKVKRPVQQLIQEPIQQFQEPIREYVQEPIRREPINQKVNIKLPDVVDDDPEEMRLVY